MYDILLEVCFSVTIYQDNVVATVFDWCRICSPWRRVVSKNWR